MDAIVLEAEADHQSIHAEIALETPDDRDRAAAADQHRFLAPFLLQRAARPRQRFGRNRQLQGPGGAMRNELGVAIGRQVLAQEGAETFLDSVRILLANETE